MSAALFSKWRRWLDRILNEQLSDLLINQHIFEQLGDCTAPYVKTYQSADLAAWMTQGYVVFAATTVRRMLEEPARPPRPVPCPHCGEIIVKPKPQKSLSLVILLRDIEQNSSLFTREWFRKRCAKKNMSVSFADRDFNKITRNRTAKVLSISRVRRDIDALHRVARPIRRRVNKLIAHTARDRRKVGRAKFTQLNDTIKALTETYQLYSLLIAGTPLSPLVPFEDYDVVADFKKIWPSR